MCVCVRVWVCVSVYACMCVCVCRSTKGLVTHVIQLRGMHWEHHSPKRERAVANPVMVGWRGVESVEKVEWVESVERVESVEWVESPAYILYACSSTTISVSER